MVRADSVTAGIMALTCAGTTSGMANWTKPTTLRPVSGRVYASTSHASPFFVTCSISTMTRRAPLTRSIVPPILSGVCWRPCTMPS
jgi:hypothetical protein